MEGGETLTALTLGLGVPSDVFFQVVLPLQSLLLWHHTPNDSYTSLPELTVEGLRHMVEIPELDLWDDLGSAFDNVWTVFSKVFQQAMPGRAHLALIAFDETALEVSVLRRERLEYLSRKRHECVGDIARAFLCVCRCRAKLCSGACRWRSDGAKCSKREHGGKVLISHVLM
jgi:hypothetical protein